MVLLATNIEENHGEVTVQRRQKGTAEKARVKCPMVVSNYNTYMGGVDLIDQRKSYYELDRKSKFRFYLRIFFDLMDISCVNAFIVFNQRFPKRMKLVQFKEAVADSLTRRFSSRKRSFPQSRQIQPAKIIKTSADHLPVFRDSRRRCVYCSQTKEEQRTFIECSTCNVSLCLVKNRNCFQEFHCK